MTAHSSHPHPHAHRILVIEDDSDIRELVEMVLTDAGHEVLTAEDGGVGLTLLDYPDNVAVVLLDWRMPTVSGAEFLARYRTLAPDQQNACIILFTAAADATQVAHEAGIAHVLAKPARVAQILRAVADALDAAADDARSASPT